MRQRQIAALFDEQLAVRILRIDQVLADEVGSLPVGENLPVEAEHGDVEIAVVELAALPAELGVGLGLALLLATLGANAPTRAPIARALGIRRVIANSSLIAEVGRIERRCPARP